MISRVNIKLHQVSDQKKSWHLIGIGYKILGIGLKSFDFVPLIYALNVFEVLFYHFTLLYNVIKGIIYRS